MRAGIAGSGRVAGLVAGIVAVSLLTVGCSGQAETAPAVTSGVSTPNGASSDEPLVVARRDFSVTFKLDGSTRAGTAVLLDERAGVTLVPAGKLPRQVTRGETIGRYEPVKATATTPSDRSLAQLAQTLAGPVTASGDGVFRARAGRYEVASEGLDVAVPLTPVQALRYRSMPFTGTASTESLVGRTTTPCEGLWLSAAAPQAAGGASDSGAAAVEQLNCRLSARVESAPGLRAQLTLTSVLQKGVLTVPVLGLAYDDKTGTNYVTVSGPQPRRVPVTLGATDGVARVISGDVREGDVIEEAPTS